MLYLFGCLLFLTSFMWGCSDDGSSAASSNVSDGASNDSLVVPMDTVPSLPFVGGPVMFTEVSPINIDFKDHEGDDAGWVELFNTSLDTVDLSGLSLTDSKAEPRKWILGNVKLAPNGYMIVFMSGKNLTDFVAPHDSLEMIGTGCWTWTDSQNEIPGESYGNPLEGKSKTCFKEEGIRRFGATMKLGENQELGWSSISVFVGTGRGDSDDVSDLSATNEILMQAYITKDRQVSFKLTQTGLDDWKGYEILFTGTGDSSTVYRAMHPVENSFPDLANIYGTRMSPASNETQEVSVKVFSYIARNRGHEPHAAFKLNKKGGALYLVNGNHEIVDSVAYPQVPVGKSWQWGILGENQIGFGFAEPSPYGLTAAPVIGTQALEVETLAEFPPSGFYELPFAVALNGGEIRCGQGGLAPTLAAPVLTQVVVEKTTVLRCTNFSAGALPSNELVRTYIFETAPAVPAVFLTTDPNSLFDPDSGIYMEGNFAQEKEPHYGANYWLDKEIPTFVELMEPGMATPAFAKQAGLKIFGNYSRQNDKKSVAVTFREKYGDKRLKYSLFPEHPELNSFKSFILRNNGSNFKNDYIRDRLASSLSEGLGVDYQRGRAAVVFYNGEYYGIHNIRERSTEFYFETHYGIDPEDIDLLKADNSASVGSGADYEALMAWLETNHLDSDENFAYVASQIDVENFMNYVITEIYANNRDWPGNNLKKWRDGKRKTLWKWFLYDMDFGFGTNMSAFKNNIFEFATAEDGDSWPNGPEYTLLLRRILENVNAKNGFINRMLVLLSKNFESSRVLERINVLMAEIQGEIQRDQKRWDLSSSWMNSQLGVIKKFAKDRPGVLYEEMQDFFGLGEFVSVTLSVNGPGVVAVHGIPLGLPAATVLFNQNVPVKITALPQGGGVWAGWSDGVMEPERVIVPGEIVELSAYFK